jgi:methionyl-tRNA formyltransferase
MHSLSADDPQLLAGAIDGIARIIILTNTALGRSLAGAIVNFKPRIEVELAETIDFLRSIPKSRLADARLISFCSSHVVPPDILHAFGYGAYNFHPGPPEYPGWAPYSFALYDDAVTFGATAHRMTDRVDAGPVVGVERFPVPHGLTLPQLLNRTNGAMFQLFASLADALVNRPEPLAELAVNWGHKKTTKRDFSARCQLSPDISVDELHRIVRAFGIGDGFTVPETRLHGIRFALVPIDF